VIACSHTHIGVGTIFQLGAEQKLNDFLVKLVKNNQDNQIQSITLCNMFFFRKRHRPTQTTQCTMGSGAKP